MLETRRLILRPFRESDNVAAHMWFSDPEVFRFYMYGPYRSLEETTNRIREYIRQFETEGFGKWIVIEKATGTPVGDAGLMLAEETGEVHVGYKIARAYWGQGLATEAAQAWLKHGFDHLALKRITAFIHSQNAASIRVVQKLQFSFCRSIRKAEIDWNVYELLWYPSKTC